MERDIWRWSCKNTECSDDENSMALKFNHAAFTDLIIVPGHAVYIGDKLTSQEMAKERNWFLERFLMCGVWLYEE